MIKKLILFFALFIISNSIVNAQIKLNIGADSNDVISNIVMDKFGNFYIAANFSSSILIDKESKNKISSKKNSQDILLAKFNALGKIIWFKKIGSDAKDEVRDMKIDAYGNLFLVGSFNNECQFDNSSKKIALISNGKSDGFIAKYLSTTGDIDWAINIGGEYNDDINSVCIDNADGIAVSGRFTKFVDMDNSAQNHLLISTSNELDNTTAFIARYSAYDGKYIFANTVGVTNNNNSFQGQNCVEVDEKNNFYLLSTYTNEIDINPNGSPILYKSKGKNDLVLIKFDINGKVLESFSIGSEGNEICNNRCIAINKKNEIALSFSYQENCKIVCKNKSINLAAKGETDLAILKFNNKLTDILFNASLSQEGTMNNNQLLIDNKNQIWVAGYSKLKYKAETKTKQKSVPIYIAPSNNYFIYKLDNSGNIISQKTGNPKNENCAIHTIQQNSFTKELFIGGNYNNSITWDNNTFKSKGKKDFFVLKLNEDFSIWQTNPADTSSNLTTENFTIDVKSNATNTLLNIKYFVNKHTSQNIELIDYKGNIIKQIPDAKQSTGLQQIFYDISYLSQGKYFIKLNNITKSFIKN